MGMFLVITSDADKIYLDFGTVYGNMDKFPEHGTMERSDILEVFKWEDYIEVVMLSGAKYYVHISDPTNENGLKVESINSSVPVDLSELYNLVVALML